jgi:hypothetical protein
MRKLLDRDVPREGVRGEVRERAQLRAIELGIGVRLMVRRVERRDEPLFRSDARHQERHIRGLYANVGGPHPPNLSVKVGKERIALGAR